LVPKSRHRFLEEHAHRCTSQKSAQRKIERVLNTEVLGDRSGKRDRDATAEDLTGANDNAGRTGVATAFCS
jgi:hypothetical protein